MRFSRYLTAPLLLCLTAGGAYSQEGSPLIRIGVIADIQYGDLEAAGTRYYRNSLGKLEAAVADLNSEKVDFTVNLGDLTDRNPGDLAPVLDRLKALDRKVYNTTGNHDYVGISDNGLLYKQLDMPGGYYSFTYGKWRFIMLNTNEIASYSNLAGTGKESELAAMLGDIKAGGRNNDKSWNGGVGAKQMKWLTGLLEKARRKGENVLVVTHHPLFPAEEFTALNNLQILEVLSSFSCVKGVISGHHHTGAFGTYEGVPCITTEGMVETEKSNAYGILEIYKDRLVLRGKGRTQSYDIQFRGK